MKILIDADACPVVSIVEEIAQQYQVPLLLICDTSHIIDTEYGELITVDKGADSVDFFLINKAQRKDIIVTQDYGVAAMALGKGAYAIHQSGKWYTEKNIDQMLFERHMSKKARRSSGKFHGKGPRKRTVEDDLQFRNSFQKLIEKVLGEMKEEKEG